MKKKTLPCSRFCHLNDQLPECLTSDTDIGGTCIPLVSTLQICTAGLAIVQHTPVELICSTTTNTLAFSSCSRLDHGGWGARRARHIWRARLLPSRQREARRLAKYAGPFLYQLSPADTMSASRRTMEQQS